MENDLNLGIAERSGEWFEADHREWVDNGGLLPRRQLQQVDAIVETMEAGRLGIDCQKRLAPESLEEIFQLGLALDQANTGLR
jgi:hypothetical protein